MCVERNAISGRYLLDDHSDVIDVSASRPRVDEYRTLRVRAEVIRVALVERR